MTWTYSVSDLATSQKDQVRLAIGDTLSTDPQLQDEEIAFYVSKRGTIEGAAAECCRTLATQYARSVDTAAGDTKDAFSQMSKAYALKATAFEQLAALGGSGTSYAGGISVADKQRQEQDSDRVPPQFNIGMEDDRLPVDSAGNELADQPASGIE